jgi:hypothetical protein
LRQPQRWTSSTPAWLRLLAAGVVALAAVTGAIAGLTVLSRAHAIGAARTTAGPLVVDAQTAVVKLSDANTTVAGAFLAGPVISTTARSRFDNDLAQASASLLAAAQRAGTNQRVTGYLQTVDTDLPIYSGLIATAETDNRQGQPVGSAYLAEANHLMNSELLPAADLLYTAEQAVLTHDNRRATDAVPVIVVIVLLAVLLATLLYFQAGLARRFRRILSVGCVVATVAILTLVTWLTIAVASEGAAVSRAEKHGTDPLGVLTQARILAGQARADDELTLVIRDSDSEKKYQQGYASVAGRLSHLFGQVPTGWTAPELQAYTGAASAWEGYSHAHDAVRLEDTRGQLSKAVGADEATSAPVAASLDATLAGGVDAAVTSFNESAQAGRSDLTGLMWGSALLMVLVIVSVLVATRRRLREYQ